jgi:cell volume regulation protein A
MVNMEMGSLIKQAAAKAWRRRLSTFGSFALMLGLLIGLSFVTRRVPELESWFSHGESSLYLLIALIFMLGYLTNRLGLRTAIPSFVWAIFFGMALQPVFSTITQDLEGIRVVVELLAALVLFGGGIEVPFGSFKKWFGPIAVLALIGTVATAVIFSTVLVYLSPALGLHIALPAAILLGAILCSTDPTAIIPSLKQLKFKRPFLKDLAVSESALNDVSGTIITRLLIVVVTASGFSGLSGLAGVYLPLLRRSTLDALVMEAFIGVCLGIIGAWILKKWAEREIKGRSSVLDPALFVAVPILMYALGGLFGGSGFLAAFVAGLLFDAQKPLKQVRHFFEQTVDGFVKPIIFILLGALVPVALLIQTSAVGIVSAFVFMFLIRPLVVFLATLPWSVGSGTFSWRELLFLSFVRETGVIPAVLIVVVASTGIVGSEQIVAIGMWVILLTLIIEPPLTPLVARSLGLVRK